MNPFALLQMQPSATPKSKDPYVIAQMEKTATSFQTLSALCNVPARIEVSDKGTYLANGTDCGTSVHGLYDWMKAQPSYKIKGT